MSVSVSVASSTRKELTVSLLTPPHTPLLTFFVFATTRPLSGSSNKNENEQHCRRAKALLAEKSIPYREVDVTRRTRESGDKTVLAAIQQFTGRRTVPQVFIAETCIGGADELYR